MVDKILADQKPADGKPGKKVDRAAADIGNIVNLGHLNVNIADQRLATHYYISALGLTRDPFLNTGVRIMWVNVGVSQFHLPTGEPHLLRGVTGLVIPDRAALLARLGEVMGYAVEVQAGPPLAGRSASVTLSATAPVLLDSEIEQI